MFSQVPGWNVLHGSLDDSHHPSLEWANHAAVDSFLETIYYHAVQIRETDRRGFVGVSFVAATMVQSSV